MGDEELRARLDAIGPGPWSTAEVVTLVRGVTEGATSVLDALLAGREVEERPVGEHDFGKDGCCVVCGVLDMDVEYPTDHCTSERERRWVTPWEPVPQEDEKGLGWADTAGSRGSGVTGAAGAESGEARRTQ